MTFSSLFPHKLADEGHAKLGFARSHRLANQISHGLQRCFFLGVLLDSHLLEDAFDIAARCDSQHGIGIGDVPCCRHGLLKAFGRRDVWRGRASLYHHAMRELATGLIDAGTSFPSFARTCAAASELPMTLP